MPRTLKTNGIYTVECTLTGEPAGTTPAVFAERAKRYGVSIDVLKDSYIGRTGAGLLKNLVNEKKQKPTDAINEIRKAFNVKTTSSISDKVISKIVGQVSAKARKAAKLAEFAKTKAAAVAALTGSDDSAE